MVFLGKQTNIPSRRLSDVLFLARYAICSSRSEGDRLTFPLYRVPRDGQSTKAVLTTLNLIVGPGDDGEGPAWEIHVEVLEVVLASAANADMRVHSRGRTLTRISG